MAKPIVIVGAGLAGLVCARRLHRAGLPVSVLEKSDRPGGRLKTDALDGFLLDRGFQTTFTAYPNQQAEVDIDALDLRRFEPGARVLWGGRFHDVHRDMPVEMAFSRLFTVGDKLRVLAWTREVAAMTVDQIRHLDDEPTIDHLVRYGFSDRFLDRFARPFLGGIFLDRSLSFSKRQFAFVWKMLAEGATAVPSLGIEAIPRQIAGDLPAGTIRTGVSVASVTAKSAKLEDGETVEAEAVVVATEPPEAARLAGVPVPAGARSSVCLYFEAPEPPVHGNYLLLDGEGRGLVNHVVPVSNLSEHFAPAGRALVSATVLGALPRTQESLLTLVRHDLRRWWPDGRVDGWRHLRTYAIPYAQMPQPPGRSAHLGVGPSGAFVAGEAAGNASIDGAIESGRRAADVVLATLGARSEDPVGVEA